MVHSINKKHRISIYILIPDLNFNYKPEMCITVIHMIFIQFNSVNGYTALFRFLKTILKNKFLNLHTY